MASLPDIPWASERGGDVHRADSDVLVIGGGLAGAWAAVSAARAGASVILADKGYFGTSGVTAAAGPGHWWVPPEKRETAVADRLKSAAGLGDPQWMDRILDLTWRTLPTLERYYRFPKNEAGETQYRSLRGPEYLRAMRRLALDAGVVILDHSPGLELLLHEDGSVAGAAGIMRQIDQTWAVRAGAVVLATGGCAFASRLHGSRNNTGDGHLMAAEAGADFSGMEFSAYYVPGPAHIANTRSMLFSFGRYFDAEGRELAIGAGERAEPLGHALTHGPVFCTLDRTPEDIRAIMPSVQPNFMLGFARAGIDPYRDRFEVTLHGEGTIRGVGGVRVATKTCETEISGLFVAGDVASRELVTGAVSGGGAINSSWALSSGHWAGEGAAALAKRRGRRLGDQASASGRAGLRPRRTAASVDTREAVEVVRGEMNPPGKNLFRTHEGLHASRDLLEQSWSELADHARGEGRDAIRLREAAAMTAVARWCVASALARPESRGMHHRVDRPGLDPNLARRQRSGGLETTWQAFEPPIAGAEAA